MLSKKKSEFIIRRSAARVDFLEARRLLSAVLGSDGTLTVTGTSGDDDVVVNFKTTFSGGTYAGNYDVKVNGVEASFDAGNVRKMIVNGLQGNDVIYMNGMEVNDSSTAQTPVNVVISEGDGNDSVYSDVDENGFASVTGGVGPSTSVTVGNGADTVSVQGSTLASIVAGNGDDMFIVGQGLGNDPITVSLTAGNGTDQIDAGSSGVQTITVNATVGTGQDSFSNENNSNVFINATTTDGQTLGAYSGQGYVSGRVTTLAGKPVAGALVFLDSDDNSVVDGSEPIATTNANGDYQLVSFSTPYGSAATFNGTLRMIDAGYTATSIRSQSATGLGLSGLDFIQTPVATAGQPLVFGTAGSYQNQGNTIANAVDGNLNTYFDAPTNSGGYVALDYGSPQVFSTISYAPRSGWAGRMVGGIFQGSNSASFSNAVTLYKVTSTPVVGKLTTVPVSAAGAFEFVRYLGPAGSFCNIAEIDPTVVAQAGTVVVQKDGTLVVTGSSQADSISVNFTLQYYQGASQGVYTVQLNNSVTDVNAGSVKELVINGGDGDDVINVVGNEYLEEYTSIPADRPVNTVVNAGAGNNNISLSVDSTFGSGYSQSEPAPGATVNAGDGNNEIFIGDITSAVVNVGNGNNSVDGSAGGLPEDVTVNAGNGSNAIAGDSAGNSVLYMVGHVGTGHDYFSNGNDPDITVSGTTGNGQSILLSEGVDAISGRATLAGSGTPVADQTVFIDADGNGILDAGEQSAKTNSLGVYSFTITGNDGDYGAINYPVRLLSSGYTVAPAVLNESFDGGGAGVMNDNFVLTPVAGTPVLFGTSGSYQNDGNTIAKAVDGNLNTFFDAPAGSGGYVALDYGSPQSFSQVSFAPRSGWASRMVGGTFQASNSANFSSAVNLYTITSAPVVGKLTTVNLTAAGTYRYVRYIGPSGSFCNIAEMKFKVAPQPNSVTLASDGTLTITGTEQSDTIKVNFFDDVQANGSSGTYTVVLNGVTSTWDASQVTGISINGFDGDDNIDVEGLEQNDTSSIPALVNTTINEGNGNNTINTYLQEDGISDLPGGVGPGSYVTAGNGNNNILIYGAGVGYVKVGDGNNQLSGGTTTSELLATFYAGNGNNVIGGASAGNSSLDIQAHVGTGQNSFYNGQDIDIRVEGSTTDGQGVTATNGEVYLAGRVYSGTVSSPSPVAGATVFIDANNNGVLDSGEQTAVTDSNGDYQFEIASTDGDVSTTYTVRLANTSFSITPSSYQKTTSYGVGFTGLDFLVLPVAAQPVLFGTSGSYQNDGNTIANVVDGNLNTYFDAPTGSGGYVALDYGSPQVFSQIQYAPRAGWESRMVGGVFQGSNSANFSNAVTLFKITAAPKAGVLTLANVTGAGAFRYVRYVGPAGSLCNIAEMDFILAGTLKGTAIGTAGSYHNLGNTISNAFDGNATTFFDGPDASGDWVRLNVGTATLKAVEFEARAGFESRMVGGEIQASNSADFSSGVVTLATITSKPQTGVLTTLGISNIYGYSYYRYIGPSNSYCDIAELEFIG